MNNSLALIKSKLPNIGAAFTLTRATKQSLIESLTTFPKGNISLDNDSHELIVILQKAIITRIMKENIKNKLLVITHKMETIIKNIKPIAMENKKTTKIVDADDDSDGDYEDVIDVKVNIKPKTKADDPVEENISKTKADDPVDDAKDNIVKTKVDDNAEENIAKTKTNDPVDNNIEHIETKIDGPSNDIIKEKYVEIIQKAFVDKSNNDAESDNIFLKNFGQITEELCKIPAFTDSHEAIILAIIEASRDIRCCEIKQNAVRYVAELDLKNKTEERELELFKLQLKRHDVKDKN